VDFSLEFVLEQARITQPFAHRRLSAFENTVTSLARRWRPQLPLVPDRELRMSDETREALLGWIEAEEAGQGHTLTRLAGYAARVTDNAVPEGWVRLHLPRGVLA
jgi:hypothetical protein